MRNWWRDWSIGFSVANLLLLTVWSELLYTSSTAAYYMLSPPAASDYLAAVFNTFLLGTFFFAVVQIIKRWGNGWHKTVVRIVFIGSLLIALNIIRFQFTTNFGIGVLHARISRSGMIIPALIAVVLLVIALFYFRRKIFKVITILVLFLAPFALITTGQGIIKAFTLKSHYHESSQKLVINKALKKGPRVVWIIFDELDRNLLYENRPEKFYTSDLDAFWLTSISIQKAQTPSNLTLISIPSLLTATTLVESNPQSSSELAVVPQGSSTPTTLSSLPNVFGRAKEAGFATTAIGWYHPYCRLFQKNLDSCSWQPVFQTVTGQIRADEKKLLRTMADQLATIYPFNRRRLAIHAYRNILEDSKKVLKSSSGLIFLHFPIPHPPAIYNRNSEKLTTLTLSNVDGYVDNVALVDRAFGQLKLTLIDAGLWDETAVILTSDHPWRDAAVFSGKQSLYVPFLLKMPHQKTRLNLDVLFQTIKTADLVLAILKGEVKTEVEAAQWIESNSQLIK